MNKYVKARANYIEKERARETRRIKRRMNKFVRSEVKRLVYMYTHGAPAQTLRASYTEFNSYAVRTAVTTRVLNELYYKGIKFTVGILSNDSDYDVVRAIYFYGASDAPTDLYKPEEE